MDGTEGQSMQLDIDIPVSALTTCPDKNYNLVSILNRCFPCPYSRGLVIVMKEDKPFDQKYRVHCGVPQVREIIIADLGG